jgi:hypothetical protein
MPALFRMAMIAAVKGAITMMAVPARKSTVSS